MPTEFERNKRRSGHRSVTLNLFQGPLSRKLPIVPDQHQPCVYILASYPRGTLYIGVTSNLIARLWQHRNNVMPGFTAKHHVHMLVHFEVYGDMVTAISREKQLKRWHRSWKLNLIESGNPHWADLAVSLGLPPATPGKADPGP